MMYIRSDFGSSPVRTNVDFGILAHWLTGSAILSVLALGNTS